MHATVQGEVADVEKKADDSEAENANKIRADSKSDKGRCDAHNIKFEAPDSSKTPKTARKSIGKKHTKSTSTSPDSNATLLFPSGLSSMTSIILTP